MRSRLFGSLSGTLLALAAVNGCSASAKPADAAPSPSSTRQYVHPTQDLSRVTADCDSENDPYLTLWITNHSAHSMAYDIKYNLVDADGKTVGSAGGVFTVEPHGVIGDKRLSDITGHCSKKARLAYVNAYIFEGHGNDQPSF